jgi:hypothetical protein
MTVRGKIIYFRHGPYSPEVMERMVKKFIIIMKKNPKYSDEEEYFEFHPLPKAKTQEEIEMENSGINVPQTLIGYGYLFVKSPILFNMIVWGKYEVSDDYGKQVKIQDEIYTIGTKRYDDKIEFMKDNPIYSSPFWADEDDLEKIIEINRFDENTKREHELEFKPPILTEKQLEWIRIYNEGRKNHLNKEGKLEPKDEMILIDVFNSKREKIGRIFPLLALPGRIKYKPNATRSITCKIRGISSRAGTELSQAEIRAVDEDIRKKVENFVTNSKINVKLINRNAKLYVVNVEFDTIEDATCFMYMYKKIKYSFEETETEVSFNYFDMEERRRY